MFNTWSLGYEERWLLAHEMLFKIFYNLYGLYYIFLMINCSYRSQQFFQVINFFFGFLGVKRINCLNCPRTIAVNGFCVKSNPNSSQVYLKVSCKFCISLWSKAGNRWCNVWSPNVTMVIKKLSLGSFRSALVSIWWSPQSMCSALNKWRNN